MQHATKIIPSRHYWSHQAGRDHQKWLFDHGESVGGYNIGKPVPLPGRTLHLHEITGEWLYYPKVDIEV